MARCQDASRLLFSDLFGLSTCPFSLSAVDSSLGMSLLLLSTACQVYFISQAFQLIDLWESSCRCQNAVLCQSECASFGSGLKMTEQADFESLVLIVAG